MLEGEVQMPECGSLYLIEYLFEVGPTMVTSVGASPLTHGEIESWQNNTGLNLNNWEAKMIRTLSINYLQQSKNSTKKDSKAPFGESARIIQTNSMQNDIRRMAQ